MHRDIENAYTYTQTTGNDDDGDGDEDDDVVAPLHRFYYIHYYIAQ